MRDHHNPPDVLTPLDELARELLECGGVLSQIVASMVRFEEAGLSDPDAVPIPEMAQSLVRDVLDEVGKRHSKRDIRVAASIVSESSAAICENLFAVDPAFVAEHRND